MLPVAVAEQPISKGFIALALSYEISTGVAMTDNVVNFLRERCPVCGDLVQAHIGYVDHLVIGAELLRFEHHAVLTGNKGQQVSQSEALMESLPKIFLCHRQPLLALS